LAEEDNLLLYVFASVFSHDVFQGFLLDFQWIFQGVIFFFDNEMRRHEFFREILEECQDASSMSGPMPKELEAEALTK